MKDDYWINRWEQGEIGFHQTDINPYLRQFWQELKLAADASVLVPLCGKSSDMLWLREQSHRVLGVELSALAVRAFFVEHMLTPVHFQYERFQCYTADGLSIMQGNLFDLRKEELASVNAVYDRAALVALPPEMRIRYVSHLLRTLPAQTQILLITLDYPHTEMAGPPFSVSPDEVEALYRDCTEIRVLVQVDVLEENPRFKQRGLSRLRENVFLITL